MSSHTLECVDAAASVTTPSIITIVLIVITIILIFMIYLSNNSHSNSPSTSADTAPPAQSTDHKKWYMIGAIITSIGALLAALWTTMKAYHASSVC